MSELGPTSAASAAVTGAIKLTQPSPEAGSAVVLHFVWSGTEMKVAGDISRGSTGLGTTRAEVHGPLPIGITHHVMRRVPLGDILTMGRAYLAERMPPSNHSSGPVPLPPGRVLMTPDLLRLVALAYIEETVPGKDRAIFQRLSERLGRPRDTVRTWVKRARKDGWLGPSPQGRGGAEPGPRLMAEQAPGGTYEGA